MSGKVVEFFVPNDLVYCCDRTGTLIHVYRVEPDGTLKRVGGTAPPNPS